MRGTPDPYSHHCVTKVNLINETESYSSGVGQESKIEVVLKSVMDWLPIKDSLTMRREEWVEDNNKHFSSTVYEFSQIIVCSMLLYYETRS